GILNVKDLFGVTAIRERKRIDVVVKLSEWSRDVEYDRMGLDDRHHTILGINIPELVIPVRPGRDMASILEVAARNELLKNAGHHAAREFSTPLGPPLRGKADRPARISPRPPIADEAPTPPPPPRARTPAARPPQARGLPRAPESSASIPKPR